MWKQTARLWQLFVVVFLDMLSYAMLSPVIILLFIDGPTSLLQPGTKYGYAILGLFLSTYSFVQTFSLPYWGKKSIVIGKRKVLMISLFGSAFGYLICWLGVYLGHVALLFLGVFCAGLTGANMSSIQALISQETDADHWERNFSLQGAIIGIAFIIGPQLTRILMGANLGKSLPLWVLSICVACSLLSFLLVLTLVQERQKSDKPFGDTLAFELESLAQFSQLGPQIKRLLVFLFGVYFGWFFFIKFFQVYLLEMMHVDEKYCCHGSSYLGLCCSLWQSCRYLFNPSFLQRKSVLLTSTFLMAFGLGSFVFIQSFEQMIVVTLILSFAYATIVPTTIGMIFKTACSHNDYKASLSYAIQSAAKILTPACSGFLLTFSFTVPVLVSFGIVFCAGLVGLLAIFTEPQVVPKSVLASARALPMRYTRREQVATRTTYGRVAKRR